jgi:peroxiredoxin
MINGNESWELPIPAIYILDRDGTVLYASAKEDYTDRPEPKEIVSILQSMPPPLSLLRG